VLRDLDGPALSGLLDHATRIAADTCTRPGSDPPWRRGAG
jgi:hypothetical protein